MKENYCANLSQLLSVALGTSFFPDVYRVASILDNLWFTVVSPPIDDNVTERIS